MFYVGSWPKITALSAFSILAFFKTSIINGEPLIKKILGNLLIESQISLGIVYIGVIITMSYCLLSKYFALRGKIKCIIEL